MGNSVFQCLHRALNILYSSPFQAVYRLLGNQKSLTARKECLFIEFKMSIHTSCLVSSGPPLFSFTIYNSLWFTECMLTRMLTVQREVCVWRKEGGAFPFNASALLSVSQSLRIYSVYFLFLPLPRVYSVCLVSVFFCLSVFLSLMSDTHAQLTHLCHTGSHIHQACVIPPLSTLCFSCSISWILAVAPPSQLLYSAFTPWLCSLCQESGADRGGCFKSVFATSEATCLWHLSLSLSLCPLAHPSLFLPLVTSLC